MPDTTTPLSPTPEPPDGADAAQAAQMDEGMRRRGHDHPAMILCSPSCPALRQAVRDGRVSLDKLRAGDDWAGAPPMDLPEGWPDEEKAEPIAPTDQVERGKPTTSPIPCDPKGFRTTSRVVPLPGAGYAIPEGLMPGEEFRLPNVHDFESGRITLAEWKAGKPLIIRALMPLPPKGSALHEREMERARSVLNRVVIPDPSPAALLRQIRQEPGLSIPAMSPAYAARLMAAWNDTSPAAPAIIHSADETRAGLALPPIPRGVVIPGKHAKPEREGSMAPDLAAFLEGVEEGRFSVGVIPMNPQQREEMAARWRGLRSGEVRPIHDPRFVVHGVALGLNEDVAITYSQDGEETRRTIHVPKPDASAIMGARVLSEAAAAWLAGEPIPDPVGEDSHRRAYARERALLRTQEGAHPGAPEGAPDASTPPSGQKSGLSVGLDGSPAPSDASGQGVGGAKVQGGVGGGPVGARRSAAAESRIRGEVASGRDRAPLSPFETEILIGERERLGLPRRPATPQEAEAMGVLAIHLPPPSRDEMDREARRLGLAVSTPPRGRPKKALDPEAMRQGSGFGLADLIARLFRWGRRHG